MPSPADKMPDLGGREILIAESNALIALDLAETLRGWGARPVLYNELPEAEREAVSDRVFAALIDLSQCHAEQTELCDALQQRKVPIVLTTAWQRYDIGNQFPGMTVFEKPVNYSALAQWFEDLSRQAPP